MYTFINARKDTYNIDGQTGEYARLRLLQETHKMSDEILSLPIDLTVQGLFDSLMDIKMGTQVSIDTKISSDGKVKVTAVHLV